MSRKAHLAILLGGTALAALGLWLWSANGVEIVLDAVIALCG